MAPDFSITVDPARGLLSMTLSGFFDGPTIARFTDERNAAVKRLRCAPNQHVTICDLRRQMISTPEATNQFKEIIADPRYASRRLAIIVEKALARLQTQRIVSRDHVGYFHSVEEAEAWQFAPAETQ